MYNSQQMEHKKLYACALANRLLSVLALCFLMNLDGWWLQCHWQVIGIGRHMLYASPLASRSHALCARSHNISGTNMVLWPGTYPPRPALCYFTGSFQVFKSKAHTNQLNEPLLLKDLKSAFLFILHTWQGTFSNVSWSNWCDWNDLITKYL